MPVAKGGVWTNLEDEILKASVSKYGLNQWARVSSLLARKSPKQCKARWQEWLDPSIRKIEWSKEEDEKLLHLAKLMPTQWRTIAPIVGRTATQCLERYQKLLDDAEARETDEFALEGPEGGETAPPNADDVRRLRPGELDPDPESKPAKPDTIDMDEDEKEMLSEARARLANTQGKKAKRKARERQLEESRRMANLQKRRELKNAGINIKIVNRKKGQMDYNADIPFEKAPAPGFYDTVEEMDRNEKQREAFDPRKQQLANKRKGDQEDDGDERKRRKNEKSGGGGGGGAAAFAAPAQAARLQRLREAERSNKRRSLNLPAPQVGESELEEIVKMGMAGERASRSASAAENDATRGLVGNYNAIVGGTPIRTPRAPQEENRIANEIKNARALTDTQSALLGGDNTPLHEGRGTTGFEGVAPSKNHVATPNPLATPMRNGLSQTPGATPLRTPRDNFSLNREDGMALVAQTPRDVRLREIALKQDLRGKFSALPKPRETEWELELPEEQADVIAAETTEEDAAVRDARNEALRKAAELADFKRQTQVIQKGLPRPSVVDVDAMLKNATELEDSIAQVVAHEAALLIANDALKFGGAKVNGAARPVEVMDEAALNKAKLELALEISTDELREKGEVFQDTLVTLHTNAALLGLDGYSEDDLDERQLLTEAFDTVQDQIMGLAEQGSKTEKKLAIHLGGYQHRQKMLRQKIVEASDALDKATWDLDTKRTAQVAEQSAISRRLEGLREEVTFVSRREREAQDLYRNTKEELEALDIQANGYH
ncbi:hypothetical protein P152DRAFT_460451 [Eremomyces bilateralis CBS 781.70]|uniref:Cell division control protein n=1 Tax=Eremomyces bilateralis CBS 781.70 TaxID=1392243 RepID=A0A6G1FX41_9PEZI|nr:uncharacterized protein P152DRAFT_460451 [Eremomyces bilateralis CBS 781.70]KAF1810344.1 hypothetical protein P152DRAFT_460451 [Eremomyces bilateralis CBS 781.70]